MLDVTFFSFHGLRRCVFGARGVGALWRRVGGTAAPDAVRGADAGGRVSPGANQPGHASCGHWGRQRHERVVSHRIRRRGAASRVPAVGQQVTHRSRCPTSACRFESSTLWPSGWIQIWWRWVWGSVHTEAPDISCSVWTAEKLHWVTFFILAGSEEQNAASCRSEVSNVNYEEEE